MKRILLLLLILPVFAQAQFNYWGPFFDSTKFTFLVGDSLVHKPIDTVRIDTSSTRLWRIGSTTKPVFSSGPTAHGIMTDTLHPYPANANDFFVLKISGPENCIINFWHKYQTDSFHAGGIVEFSKDSITWTNITACLGIATQNFYSSSDTLISGQASFMGRSTAEQLSRFQLMNCVALRTTTTGCFPDYSYYSRPIFIRFRFVSDTTVDSLSGWMIDSIRVVFTGCGSAIDEITGKNIIQIYPDPAEAQITITSSALIDEITVHNLLGKAVYKEACKAYEVQLDIADLPPGLYFIIINGTEVRKFLKE